MICHHQRTNDPQQQKLRAKIAGRQQQMATGTANRLRQSVPSAVCPSPHLSPPASSSSSHRFVLSRAGWRGNACPDGDLLPASWFMLSSEDLFRLHQKLQRRVDRRRSLNKANFPFGEANWRRANILQKYRHFPADGLRRSLSDQHIRFMDPQRDVEATIARGPKGNSWSAASKSSSVRNASKKKRVSFSTAQTIVPPSASAEDIFGGGEKAIGGTPMEKQRTANEQSFCLPPDSSVPAHSVAVPLPPLSAIPVKPILARKFDSPSSSSAYSSSISATTGPNSMDEFRRRINTVTNIGDNDSLCAMDYATFRAWRRGSRLSIDVLNGGEKSAAEEVQKSAEAAKMLGKSAGGTARVDVGGWAQLVKRILDDCFRHRKDNKGRKIGENKDEQRGKKA